MPRQYTKVAPEARFWPRVTKSDGCWTWGGYCDEDGYGNFWFEGRTVRAHRWLWEFLNGPLGKEQQVLHRCDNPPCVRPDHLFVGTHDDNVKDKMLKGRNHYGPCPKGTANRPRGSAHFRTRLTEEQVREIRSRPRLPAKGFRQLWAKEFGITVYNLADVLSGRTWKHV